MHKSFLPYILFTLLLIGLVPVGAFAESAGSLVQSGNKAFAQKDYAAALDKFEKAVEVKPDSAVALFNKGAALYKVELYDEALETFEQAADRARVRNDRRLEARSRYNMGNSSFQRAALLRRENPASALAEYKRSSSYFQAAVKLDPNLSDAASNLELSRITAKELEELLRTQKDETTLQEGQKEDIAGDLENIYREQQTAAGQSKALAQGRPPNGTGNEAVQQAARQESIAERTISADEKIARLNQEKDSELSGGTIQEHLKRAVDSQQKAAGNLQQNMPAKAHENQQAAVRELYQALQQLAQSPAEGPDKKSPDRAEADRNSDSARQNLQAPGQESDYQTEDAAPVSGTYGEESPEDIINEELQNKKNRSLRSGTGYQPVEKDW